MDETILPLFPLPLVLFPGATLPLHIFEPRYRALLADCRAGDGRFGILLTTGGPERALPPGHAGCVAELQDVTELPDGRANVVVVGRERFALDRFLVAETPYHLGVVAPLDDRDESGDAATIVDSAARVRAAFERVARAARTIADDTDAVPPLPRDPAGLSFAIAAMVDFDVGTRQRLLASRSALARLRELETLLGRAVPGIEARAEVHERARSNGHGPYPTDGTAGA